MTGSLDDDDDDDEYEYEWGCEYPFLPATCEALKPGS